MKIIWVLLLVASFAVHAERFQSSAHKVSLLELYTSEGCNSCPPAESWLARIDRQGYRPGVLVPLAMHVTYWDYLGWQDKFAKPAYDQRQRKMVRQVGGKTVYTPQFFLNAVPIRSVHQLKNQVDRLSMQKAAVTIHAELNMTDYDMILNIGLQRRTETVDDVLQVKVVPYQNNIKSAIAAGENKGRNAQHQYVARGLQAALMSLKGSQQRQFYFKRAAALDWSGMVVIIETDTEVIQVLDIPLSRG